MNLFRRRGLDRQMGGFPSGDAAGNFADVSKSVFLQQAGGDGGPVTAGAKHQQGAVVRQLIQIFRQVIEREG